MKSKSDRIAIRPRIRILRDGEIAFGPGKAELLTHLQETGSLNQAARLMNMSYMKAWLLVQIMNRSYRRPLVKSSRGGAGGGGAQLTDFGREVLEVYREMEWASLQATEESWSRMRRMLAPPTE